MPLPNTVPELVGFVWPGRSVRRTELSQESSLLGNKPWPPRKNAKIHTKSNCRSLSLIPSPDFLCLKSRNSMRVSRGRKNWQSGKRNFLAKVRSEVEFKIICKGDALSWGIPFVCHCNGGNVLFHGGTSHFATYPLELRVPCFGTPSQSKGMRTFSTPCKE